MPVGYIDPGDPDILPKNNPPGGGPGVTGPGPGGGAGGGGGATAFGSAPGSYGITPNTGRRINDPLVHAVLQYMAKGGFIAHGPGTAHSDSIPAMLSKGEYVVRADVASHPIVKHFLDHLNAGNIHPAILHACMGGDVRGGDGASLHMAGGGPVGTGGQAHGWYHPGTGSQYGGGMMGGQGHYGPSGPMPAASAAPAAPGGATGGFTNADPWGPYANDQRGDVNGIINRLIGQYGKAGSYGPGGNQTLLNSVNEQAQRNARAYQSQAGLAADVSGMDPAQAATARLQALVGSQRTAGNILGAAQTQELQRADQFGKDLFSGVSGNTQAAGLQQWLANHQPGQGNGLAGTLGGLAGAGIGSLFGPGGAAIGAGIGGKLGGH